MSALGPSRATRAHTTVLVMLTTTGTEKLTPASAERVGEIDHGRKGEWIVIHMSGCARVTAACIEYINLCYRRGHTRGSAPVVRSCDCGHTRGMAADW